MEKTFVVIADDNSVEVCDTFEKAMEKYETTPFESYVKVEERTVRAHRINGAVDLVKPRKRRKKSESTSDSKK